MVSRARPRLEPEVVDALDAFGINHARFSIIMALSSRGPLKRGELVELTELTPSTVQNHLDELRKLGMIQAIPLEDPDGQWHRQQYEAVSEKVVETFKTIGAAAGLTLKITIESTESG